MDYLVSVSLMFGPLSDYGIGEELKKRYGKGIDSFFCPISYSNGCRKIRVGAPSVGPVASVKERAESLHQFLEDNFQNQNINLIGFSMGGLDSRYLISHIKNKSYKVLSLATVATPHRGSSFMDFCRDNLGVGNLSSYIKTKNDDKILKQIDKEFIQIQHDYTSRQNYLATLLKPLDAPAFTNLTREYCAAFNRVTLDDPSVYYTSYAATAILKVFAPLAFPNWIIDNREGENDGLVSVDSARWGHFKGLLQCDHWDLIPSQVRTVTDNFKKRPFDHVHFYKTVVTDLANQGF